MFDLKTLKNDQARIAFLEDYRNFDNGWYLFKEDDDLGRRMWRFDLPECALIVEERRQTTFNPYIREKERIKWFVFKWYVVTDWHRPFEDNAGSRTMALQKLKEVTRQ